MGDRLFLEIVAKGEISQHFKERVVPRRIADIVEVVIVPPPAHTSGCWLRAGSRVSSP
jgi:hypothetical protein